MGPLAGVTVLELGGIGPGPFCGMMLADMGADVIKIESTGRPKRAPKDVMARGRRSIMVDLKNPDGVETVLRLCESVDAAFEGFRPGVTERLGVGPEECLARNPRLVYGRMTGYGQTGPLANAAGHDINYIALSGILHSLGGKDEPPTPPLNLLGDFGGGGMFLAFGLVCAILQARQTGRGQVVDAAMVDGSATLAAMFFAMHSQGFYKDERGASVSSGASHWYGAYETQDGKYVAIGSLEPKFYALLMEKLGLDANRYPQYDMKSWPEAKKVLIELFKTKTRDEWCEILEGTDVCFAPVLTMAEAPRHPQNVERQTFLEIDGILQPAPAPRFSETPAAIPSPAPVPGRDSVAILTKAGFTSAEIDQLKDDGAIDF